MAGRVLIGTSGWIYKHWRDIFYPSGLPQTRWFSFFAERFSTVEINNTFYRLPSEAAFDRWREQAPPGFTYTLKASRLITHVKRLQDCEEPLDNFISRARRLDDHLGPILYQLPPRWLPNTARLETFAQLLPRDLLHVFEFRDPRWLIEPVREVLARHQLSFCIFDMPNVQCPHWVTGSLVYLRFHGSITLYAGRYSREELAHWAILVRQQAASGHDVYAYFNNDIGGNAIDNAQELRAMLPEFAGA